MQQYLLEIRTSGKGYAVVIGIEEGDLYKLKGQSEVAMVHDTISPSELWHRRLSHIN